jgi:hypothetical protein
MSTVLLMLITVPTAWIMSYFIRKALRRSHRLPVEKVGPPPGII